ncbi:YdeI/OmpD-associated family protein [Aurantibacillus circumpalustris]|uniref:YdeI/OmpD-associated family protein n=1 Tax=Aurantibacillus circumpalustris TaxID=3036359 RepID=UPI00295C2689|nr:YdeI/OmpD-associated family protein [Aurantibacillus circumpalustris]
MEKPLVNKKYTLEKFPGKGGWTYAKIPEILQDKKAHFGWVKVKGTIDGYEIKKYHLMPMGNGNLFLPIKAEIRKKIKKKEGDSVHVILYPDNEPLEIPEEMLLCLQDEPKALKFFNTLSEAEQNNYVKHIYSAKKEETKIDRLAKAINKLLKGEKFYGQDSDL